MKRAQGLIENSQVGSYLLAGRAIVTIVSKKTGSRFTYKISQKDGDDSFYFVSLLTGPDVYTFAGTMKVMRRASGDPEREASFPHLLYSPGKRSAIGSEAPSQKAIGWLFYQIEREGIAPSTVEVYHAGSCGRCGRELTTPESLKSGLGPVCEGRIAA